jgi:hypothetical protein
LLAELQERDDEVVLGGDVVVERGLGDVACSIASLIPTLRTPRRKNSSYAVSRIRARTSDIGAADTPEAASIISKVMP